MAILDKQISELWRSKRVRLLQIKPKRDYLVIKIKKKKKSVRNKISSLKRDETQYVGLI